MTNQHIFNFALRDATSRYEDGMLHLMHGPSWRRLSRCRGRLSRARPACRRLPRCHACRRLSRRRSVCRRRRRSEGTGEWEVEVAAHLGEGDGQPWEEEEGVIDLALALHASCFPCFARERTHCLALVATMCQAHSQIDLRSPVLGAMP